MKSYLTRGQDQVEVTDLDLKYLTRLVTKDIRYQRSRSASRKGDRGDANHNKVQGRQRLLDKLDKLLKNPTSSREP